MIRRRFLVAAAAVTAVVAGCSNNNDGASPTPTPSSSGTPTPTPSATYVAFPLGTPTPANPGPQSFSTIRADTSYTGDLTGSALVTLGAASTSAITNVVTLAVQSSPSTVSASAPYVVAFGGTPNEEGRYTLPAELTTAPATTASEYVFRKNDTTTAGKFTQTDYLNNTAYATTSVVTADAALARKQVSYAAWWRGDSTTGQKRLTYTVWGYTTVATDAPTTGSSAYTAGLAARIVRANAVSGGTLTKINGVADSAATANLTGSVTALSINFATGTVTVTFVLDGVTYTGTGGIPAGTSGFSGSLSGGGLTGTFQGSLYGLRGAEVGLTFALSTDTGTATRVVGSIVGAKVP